MQKIINWWRAVKLKSHVALELELPFMDLHIRKTWGGGGGKSTKKWKTGLDKQRGKKEKTHVVPEREEESSHFSF